VNAIDGTYFDGQTNKPYAVRVECDGTRLYVHGTGIECSFGLDTIEPSARLVGVPYILRAEGGVRLQLPPDAPVQEWFPNRHRLEAWVDRLERRAPAAVAAVVAVGLALILVFGFVVPAAADYAALHLPSTVDRALGRQSLALLQVRLLQKSLLPAERRAELQAKFHDFARRLDGHDDMQLRFFNSQALGANAFALGGGIIVVTDQMVKLLPDDNAFIAVVAHEMGHERYRHMLRMILRGSGVVLVGTLLIGHVGAAGGMVMAVPAFLLNSHYSRSFEEQADAFALRALAKEDISPAAFVRALQALEKARPELRDDNKIRYVSTHPVTEERIARAQAAARRFALQHHTREVGSQQ
jgi:Zn-dependent protease with chaperone function